MKINIVLIVLILFFSLAYSVKVAGITAAGVFEVPNVLPIVKLSAHEDERFRDIKNYVNKGEEVFVKIEIEDANGREDISSVNVKVVNIVANSEILLMDYTPATFLVGNGNKVTYLYKFNANEDGMYRIYVLVKDGKDQIVQTLELTNQKNNPAITGAAVFENNAVITFFKKMFKNMLSLFST